jgi:hypothetical protein
MIPIAALSFAATILFFACRKDNTVLTQTTPGIGLTAETTERGTQVYCPRQTVHWQDLAATGGPDNAFEGDWMQELDKIANNCVLDRSLCQDASFSGQESFCCLQEFRIYTILQNGGYLGTWPNVTPQGQDWIIRFTLDWAYDNLPNCESGSPKIVAIDYYRDALVTGEIGFTVRYTCCGGSLETR